MCASRIFVSRSSAGTSRTRESSRATISGIGDFGRIGEHGVHRQADGELPAFAVVDRAAHRADFKNALLLMLGFREVFAIAEELEITQAGQHHHHPNHRQDPNDQPAETRVALLHGFRPTPPENAPAAIVSIRRNGPAASGRRTHDSFASS